jgi:GT2 family glycosyltransferase
MRISVSIVCYRNSPAQVEQALASVTSSQVETTVFLVDNSRDSVLAQTARKFGAKYIHLAHNPGFGAAHNVAMQEALALGFDYHLVMNPDISFSGNVIPALLDHMEQHREIGLIMPNVFYPDGQQQHLCKLLPNPLDLMMRRFFPSLFRYSGRLARYEMRHSGYDKIMDVPALSGCFMLIRNVALREAGSFDERFFMYLEDVDLSRRIGRLARTVYFPHVSVIHDYGKGSYKSLKLLYYHLRSAVQYFNKWGWFSDVEKKAVNRIAIQKLRSVRSINSAKK